MEESLKCFAHPVDVGSVHVVQLAILGDQMYVVDEILFRGIIPCCQFGSGRRQVHWLFDDRQIAKISRNLSKKRLPRSAVANWVDRPSEPDARFVSHLTLSSHRCTTH